MMGEIDNYGGIWLLTSDNFDNFKLQLQQKGHSGPKGGDMYLTVISSCCVVISTGISMLERLENDIEVSGFK